MEPFAQIQRFLDGELNEAEHKAFEQAMDKDPDLAQEVWLHRQLEASLSNREEIAVEKKWKQILEKEMAADEKEAPKEEPSNPSDPPKSFPFRRYLSIAAVITLLAVVGIGLYYTIRPLPPEILYASHYVPYDGSGELRTGENVPPDKWEAAFNAYNAQKYPEAEAAFTAILALSPGSPRANFYLGICAMESGELQQAQSHFEQVLGGPGNLYTDQAGWYLGLTCLQTRNRDCVEAQLKPLMERDGRYKSVARKVVRRVKWE